MVVAWLAGLSGTALIYLAAPRQLALAKPLPRWVAIIGALLLAGAARRFAHVLSPATAVYSTCVLAMLAWSLGPLAVALLRRGRE